MLLSGVAAAASGSTALQIDAVSGLGLASKGRGVTLIDTINGADIQDNALALALAGTDTRICRNEGLFGRVPV